MSIDIVVATNIHDGSHVKKIGGLQRAHSRMRLLRMAVKWGLCIGTLRQPRKLLPALWKSIVLFMYGRILERLLHGCRILKCQSKVSDLRCELWVLVEIPLRCMDLKLC